jgi:hypothetical protein
MLKKIKNHTILVLILGFIVFDCALFLIWQHGQSLPVKTAEAPKSYPELSQIQNHQASFDDLKKFFQTLAKQKGAEYAFNVLRVATLPPNTDMHLLGHVVGDMLYLQQGAKGINICTQEFRNAWFTFNSCRSSYGKRRKKPYKKSKMLVTRLQEEKEHILCVFMD